MRKSWSWVGLEAGLETWPATPGEGASSRWWQMECGLEGRDRLCQLQSPCQPPARSSDLVSQVLWMFQLPPRSQWAARA